MRIEVQNGNIAGIPVQVVTLTMLDMDDRRALLRLAKHGWYGQPPTSKTAVRQLANELQLALEERPFPNE